jgi:hypothetical protein
MSGHPPKFKISLGDLRCLDSNRFFIFFGGTHIEILKVLVNSENDMI